MAQRSGSEIRRSARVPSVVVCSIRESDVSSFRRALALVPVGCGLVEVRVDDLRTEEIAGLVKDSPRPLIVTLRRRAEGGGFDGSEEERSLGLHAALAAGARFVDVEWGSPQQRLANGEQASRVVLSYHGPECSLKTLAPILRSMASSSAARLKIVPDARSLADAGEIRQLLERSNHEGLPLACFAMGRLGAITRLMAPAWGSWATYGSLTSGRETAPGQFSVADLLGTYDVLGIGTKTRIFALLGRSVFGSPSPAMHRAGYRETDLDARYLPVELDALEDCLPLLGREGLLGVEALAVTIPFKEAAGDRCRLEDELAKVSGAVNTVLVGHDGWKGYNTDGTAVLELIRRQLAPEGVEVAIVGAGGTARAAAAALAGAGYAVTVFNRTLARAEEIARRLGVRAADLASLPAHGWEVLVQATPLGSAGERFLPREALRGRMVLDAVYGRETPLVRDARENGLFVADGLDLLVAQAVPQFRRMTARTARESTLRNAAQRWLTERAVDLP